MAEVEEIRPSVHDSLERVSELLRKNEVVESLDHRQEGPRREIADLAPDLPREVIQDVFKSLSPEEREQLRSAMSYPEDTVGALMDFDMIRTF